MPGSRTARILLSETTLPAIEVRRRIQAGKPFAFLGLYFQTADGSSSSTSGSDSNVPGELGSIGAGQEPGLAQRRTYPGCLHGDGRHLELGIFPVYKGTLHTDASNSRARQPTRNKNWQSQSFWPPSCSFISAPPSVSLGHPPPPQHQSAELAHLLPSSPPYVFSVRPPPPNPHPPTHPLPPPMAPRNLPVRSAFHWVVRGRG